jgi:hypothetical protein
MTLTEAIKAYRTLNPRQRQLLRDKRLEGSYTPAYWLKLLTPPARFDDHGDRLRRFSGGAAAVSGVLTFLGLFLYPAVSFLGGLALVVFAGIWLYLRRLDLGNQLREFILPLVTLLGDDVKEGQTVHLAMDLRGGTIKDKRIETLPPYAKGAYHKIVETLYDDHWLSGETVLSDGSQLTLTLTDHIRQLKRTKRNARGKTKIKTKYKIKGEADVQLKLPLARYRLRHLEGAPQERLRVGQKAGDKWLSLRARQVVPRAQAQLQAPPLEPVLGLLTRLYSGVEAATAEGASHA